MPRRRAPHPRLSPAHGAIAAALALGACAVDEDPLGEAPPPIAAPCGPRVAIARVAASGAQVGNPAANVLDGDLATRWSQNGVGASITADLGAVKRPCGIEVAWYRGTERTSDLAISLSTDGVAFTQVAATASSGASSAAESYPFAARDARYVRLTVLGNAENDWASVTTLAVDAAPAAGAPGSYKPSASTTGVRAGTVLRPHNTGGADLVITTDGTVLDGLDIRGDIKVRARNVVIRNSRLRGGAGIPRSNTGVIDANSALVKNLLVEDCTIIPDRPSYYRDGIVGHDYTARRLHISRSNDGLGIFSPPGGNGLANVTVEASYVHGLTSWSDDPAHADGTHNDCIQVQGGSNIRIVGNTIACDAVPGAGSGASNTGSHASQGILIQQGVAPVSNALVEKNWIDDAAASLKITAVGGSSIAVTVRDNRFGRNQYDYGNGSRYVLRVGSKSAVRLDGVNLAGGNTSNRFEDTGALLREGRDLGIRYDAP